MSRLVLIIIPLFAGLGAYIVSSWVLRRREEADPPSPGRLFDV